MARPVPTVPYQNMPPLTAPTLVATLPAYNHSFPPAAFALPTPLAGASSLATLSRLNPPAHAAQYKTAY
ncbi:MAG: hypothetical protein VKK59_01110 [Vampirovibrionales bacterium]|nr:hypothetical protein [Vampirovibrionales bacterium]